MSTVIVVEPRDGGYLVSVLGGEREATEWFRTWRSARHAADTIEDQLTEAGIDTEVREIQSA